MPRKAKATLRKWQPGKVTDETLAKLAKAFGKFGLVVEGYAKKELRRGHGVLTGTLRRSIHVAGPDYNWKADNVEPSNSAPERGAAFVPGVVQNRRLSLLVGSGMIYALKIHNGFGGFPGYHYITNGLAKAKPQLGKIIDQEFANGKR